MNVEGNDVGLYLATIPNFLERSKKSYRNSAQPFCRLIIGTWNLLNTKWICS
jgi:hypothetical protein